MRLISFITLFGLLSGIAFSWNLWWPHPERTFPYAPLWRSLENVSPGFHIFLFLVLLAGIAGTLWRAISNFKTPLPLVAVLVSSLGLLIFDQTRLQPWFFQYLIILFCITISVYPSRTFDFLPWVLGGIYFWSGIHKINPGFFRSTYPWLISKIDWPILASLGWIVPVAETLLGLLIAFRATRRAGAMGAILMHSTILFLIGPFGSMSHDWNSVVWPWNLTMIVFAVWIFTQGKRPSPIRWNQSVPTMVFVVFWILPSLHLFNLWNGYLSFSLYSGALPRASIRSSTETDLSPIHLDDWALEDLNVPSVPIDEVNRDIFRSFCGRLTPSAIKMMEPVLVVEEVNRWKWRFDKSTTHCQDVLH